MAGSGSFVLVYAFDAHLLSGDGGVLAIGRPGARRSLLAAHARVGRPARLARRCTLVSSAQNTTVLMIASRRGRSEWCPPATAEAFIYHCQQQRIGGRVTACRPQACGQTPCAAVQAQRIRALGEVAAVFEHRTAHHHVQRSPAGSNRSTKPLQRRGYVCPGLDASRRRRLARKQDGGAAQYGDSPPGAVKVFMPGRCTVSQRDQFGGSAVEAILPTVLTLSKLVLRYGALYCASHTIRKAADGSQAFVPMFILQVVARSRIVLARRWVFLAGRFAAIEQASRLLTNCC